MKLSFSMRRLTPIAKQNKSPLRQERPPEQFTFRTSPFNKTIVQVPSVKQLPKIHSTNQIYSSKNSSQRSLGYSKLNRVALTPKKTLQFGSRNNSVLNNNSNIVFKTPKTITTIKRAPLTFVDTNYRNYRRELFKPNTSIGTTTYKHRSKSQSPSPFRHQFTRKLSKNCPQQQVQTKQVSNNKQNKRIIQKQLIIPRQVRIQDFNKGKLLGKGYFGQVYIVQHRLIGFICAMKILSKQKIKAQKVFQSLLRQIKIHSFVNHENIINMYSVFSDETNVYILQELAADNLYNILNFHKNLQQKKAATYLKQTLQGLRYLHKQNIIHRDIKPQNILIGYNGKSKICDFGWAVYDPIGIRKSNIGTLLYMSPQNILGNGYDNKNDIWAVGILAYQLITGSIPFNIWVEQQKSKILTDDISFPEYIQVSKNAQSFILKMLQKQPQKRSSIVLLLEDSFLKQ